MDAGQVTEIYGKQGGAEQVVGSSGTLTVKGTLDMRTGSVLKTNGTQAGPTTALTDNGGGAVSNTLAAITVGSQLTDSTGGTPGATLAAMTAGSSYAQADMTAAKNSIASLAAQLNAANTAIGVLQNTVSSLATKVNALLTILKGINATS